MGAADAFSDVLSQVPVGSSSAFSDVLSKIPGGAPHGMAAVRGNGVKKMQQAIIVIGKTMSEYPSFNEFLTSRYIHGDRFNIGAMEGVGAGGKADGSWGGKTDIGLQSAVVLADGLAKMHASMGLSREGFDPGSLKGLVEQDHSDETASEIAKELNHLLEYYEDVAHFMQQRYGDKLSGDAPVVKYKGSILTKTETEYMQAHGDVGVAKLMDGTKVSLKDLVSEEALEQFFAREYPGKKFDVKMQAQWLLNQLGGE